MAFFAYTEGYKAFQCKFSPLVVQRAMTLSTRSPPPPLLHSALAPFYSMGLFHASKKRKTVSWSISLGVACIIGLVKRLPYPWRSVVDAGVCARRHPPPPPPHRHTAHRTSARAAAPLRGSFPRRPRPAQAPACSGAAPRSASSTSAPSRARAPESTPNYQRRTSKFGRRAAGTPPALAAGVVR